MAPIGRKAWAGGLASAVALLALPVGSQGQGGDRHDIAAGSGSNQFLIVLGEAHLSVGALSDPVGGRPSGHVRAQGDPDGEGPMARFTLEGEVTCLRAKGDRAAIKYRFKHADGSAQPFEGGGVQIFIEDNGDPQDGQPVDRATFDPPQQAGVFDAAAAECDDPDTRLGYDGIESGNFRVHDAAATAPPG